MTDLMNSKLRGWINRLAGLIRPVNGFIIRPVNGPIIIYTLSINDSHSSIGYLSLLELYEQPRFVVNGALIFMGHKDTKYDLKIIFIVNIHIALYME